MPALVGRPAPPGSTIGVVTPGSPPETRAEVERGIAWWESQGYRVKLMPGALERDDWHAGSPEVRAADLQAAFADAEVDAVQTMRGGYGSAQTIPLLDFEAIKEEPKAFFGLSDITALHAALLACAGLATFYGPSLSMVGQPSRPSFTSERFLQVLRGETTGPVSGGFGASHRRLDRGRQGHRDARRRLPPRLHLHHRDSVGARPRRLDLLLRGLRQRADSGRPGAALPRAARKVDDVRGIVAGELAGCEWDNFKTAPRSKTLEEVLTGRLGELGVPVLYNLPLGHGASLATLPLGVQATVDAEANTLTIDEPALAES